MELKGVINNYSLALESLWDNSKASSDGIYGLTISAKISAGNRDPHKLKQTISISMSQSTWIHL